MDTVRKGKQRRAKIDFNVLNDAKVKIRKMAMGAGFDVKPTKFGYPHFYYIDDVSRIGNRLTNYADNASARFWITPYPRISPR